MNQDIIVLVEGGFLFVAGIGCAAVGRQDRSWRWLALFAVMQAVARWIDIAAIDAHPSTVLACLRTTFLVVGLIALAEFAGRDWFSRRPTDRIGAGVGAGLLTLATFTWLGHRATLAVLVVLAVPVALGAARRFWPIRGPLPPGDARRLRALAFLVLPFSTLSLFPPIIVAAEAAPRYTLLVPWIAFALSSVFAILLYLHCAALRQRLLPPTAAKSWRRRRYVCTASVFGLVALGTVAAGIAGHRRDALLREQVLLRTRLAAATLDRDLVRSLQWNDSDLSSPGYVQLKRLVTALRQSNADLRFAMLMGLDHGKTFFLADSEPPTSPDYSPPGQFYEEAEPDYVQRVASRQPFVLGPIADRWGTWVTGSVPLLELGPDRAINFDLDVAAEHWNAEIRRARRPVAFIVLLVCLLIVGSFETQERLHDSTLRLAAARDAAEAATRAKSEFLAVMSHELRTPLAGVIGVIDLLRRDLPPDVRRQYVDVAADSAQTLLRLLDDILDMAKIEAGKLRLEAIPFRPHEEFKYVAEAARLRARAKGLDFSFALDPSLPDILVGDPTRLRQVLGNLQNNALKFTDAGSIAVAIAAAPLDERTVRLRIDVRDTGAGIDGPTQKRLFHKFEQADASTTRRYGGTGLGLSIVKALADAMNGTVSVESEIGRGSLFIFTAPFTLGPTAATASHPAADAAPEQLDFRLRVLCAEDDAVNRLVADGLLRELGQSVAFAENGRIAVDHLCRERFDLVLMDGRMPVLDGIKAVQLIRDPHTGVLDPEIYICALTANASDTDRHRCLAHGMDDYIAKPLRRAALVAVLKRAAAHLRARGLSPASASGTDEIAPPAHGLSEAQLLALLDESDSAAAPVLDLSPETLERLAALFRADAPPRVEAIRAGFARGDLPGVAAAAHALKSSAHYIEAFRLSQLAAEVERLVENDRPGELAPRIAELLCEFDVLLAREFKPATQEIPS